MEPQPESGLVDKEVTSILRGEYYYGDVLDRDAVAAAIKAAMAGDGGDGAPPGTPTCVADDKRSTEKVYAAYALAHFTVGPLQVHRRRPLRSGARRTMSSGWTTATTAASGPPTAATASSCPA